jgi:hypothetical protein
MKIIITTLLVIITTHCVAQIQLPDSQINNSGANKLKLATNITQAVNLAKEDIANNTPFLLLASGISPIAHVTDTIFENRYKVNYFEFDCIPPETQFAIAYDQEIFKYLEEKYGRKWKRGIRKDVLGYKEWKKNNR